MGRIGAANVLSDLYAAGVTTAPHSSVMTLAVPTARALDPTSRMALTAAMVRGYRDAMRLAGVAVTGGQTVLNPWPIIGGTVSALVPAATRFLPNRAAPGHRILLTKPLGTQLLINAHDCLQAHYAALRDSVASVEEDAARDRTAASAALCDAAHTHAPELRAVREVREQCAACGEEELARRWARWVVAGAGLSCAEVERAMDLAVFGMVRLNKEAARLMVRLGATAATDVTGFGLRGHADNLVRLQQARVRFVIERLPVWMGAVALDGAAGGRYGLLRGDSAETSGGLLIVMPPESAGAFCEALASAEAGWSAYNIGCVVAADAAHPELQMRERGVDFKPDGELEIVEVGRAVH
mmetsp:Transcript_12945/g.34872  ORF Transcript_12945/g.34872 Transcript_12945/m.34872 type:complete len:355 (+) Transcript_12945:444-1508(+)